MFPEIDFKLINYLHKKYDKKTIRRDWNIIKNYKYIKSFNIKLEPRLLYFLIKNIIKTNKYPVCKTCGKTIIKFNGYKNGIAHLCNRTCSIRNIEARKKSKKTMLDKYGKEHALQIDKFIDKSKDTCILRYKYPNAMQNKKIKTKCLNSNIKNNGGIGLQVEKTKSKAIKTNLKRYGVKYPGQNEKSKLLIAKTNLGRYGNICSLNGHCQVLMKKKTWLKNYGVENPMHDLTIARRCFGNQHKLKEYKLGSRTVNVQGYEPQALDYILRHKLAKPKEIKCGLTDKDIVPYIEYKYKNQNKKYLPDFYIPSQNRIVEVKSTWTLKNDPLFKYKRRATIKAGYNYSLLVMNGEGKRLKYKEYKNYFPTLTTNPQDHVIKMF